jgi:hypothetical protein
MERELLNRIGFNESNFRKVNEAIEAGRDSPTPQDRVAFVCECAQLGCNQIIELTLAEYEAVRSHPRRFAIVDGHEVAEAESVVERNADYTVVEKFGAAGETADATSPRDG